jgi:transposase
MTQRRKFTAEFKTQVVLDLVSGAKSAAELCRQYQLNPQLLARWKTEFLERAPLLFEQEQMHSQEQERIAELERVVGGSPCNWRSQKKPQRSWAHRPAETVGDADVGRGVSDYPDE